MNLEKQGKSATAQLGSSMRRDVTELPGDYVHESRFGFWFLGTLTWEKRVVEVALEDLHGLIDQPQPSYRVVLDAGCGQGKAFQGLVEHFQSMAMQNPERHKDIAKSIEEGRLTIRGWREQVSNIMSMGSISKMMSMIPGMPQELLAGSDEEGGMRLKRMIFIADSMTAEELDSDGMIFMKMDESGKEPIGLSWRVARVARGSGTSVREVEELLCQYRMMSNMTRQMGGKNGMMSNFQKMAQAAGPVKGPGGMPTREQIIAMQRAAPPGFLQKMRQGGGMSGMQEMMKAMMGGNVSDEEMAEMQRMMNVMPGFGGTGGLPNMSDLMKNLGGLGGFGGSGAGR